MRDAVTSLGPDRSGGPFALVLLGTAWTLVRLPLLALLVILEPVARIVLAGSALLLTVAAFFWGALLGLSAFPFWGLLALAIGAWLLLFFYYALLRVFSL